MLNYNARLKNSTSGFLMAKNMATKQIPIHLFALYLVLSQFNCSIVLADTCIGNCENGKGTYTWTDMRLELGGAMYIGEFKDKEPSGNGKLTYKNGDVYTGEFAVGTFNGKGVFKHHTGEEYSGTWSGGSPNNGNGTFHRSTEQDRNFTGEWKNGSPFGHGTIIFYSDYSRSNIVGKYVGEVDDVENMHGQGTLTLSRGLQYTGHFEYNKFHGQGVLSENGNTYTGEFKYDEPSGHGIVTFANGDRYVGEFKDGKVIQGRGTLYLPDGSESKIDWDKLMNRISFALQVISLF
jgi:hypothetical protein